MLVLRVSMYLLVTSVISTRAMAMRNWKPVHTRRAGNFSVSRLSDNNNSKLHGKINFSPLIDPNEEPKLKKRHAEDGIHGDHIKRWHYFKDTDKIYLWVHGIVPYVFGSGLSNIEKRNIWEAMNHIRKHSCVTFRVKQINDRDYIELSKSEKGCLTFIGRLKGRNVVEFDSNCLQQRSSILHQLMHVLGFFDQHQTRDRDKWIVILWYNIKPDKRVYFEIPKAPTIDAQLPYDYQSIMHLDMYDYSIGGKETMIAKASHVSQFGTLDNDFTSNDIYKIKKLYAQECKDRPRSRTNPSVMDIADNTFNQTVFGKENPNVDNGFQPSMTTESTGEFTEETSPEQETTEPNEEVTESVERTTKQFNTNQTENKIVPQMICVFWPVTIEFDKTKKNKRDTLDTLTASQELFLANNHEKYRRKCPRKND